MKNINEKLDKMQKMIEQLNVANKDILTLKEACKYTGLSESKLYKMTSNQEISYSKPDGKLFFKKQDLDNYMMSNYIQAINKTSENISDFFTRKMHN